MAEERWHTVRQGECLVTLASRYGFDDPDTIYQHADNDELRAARPNPQVLRPGDRVRIPESPQRAAGCRAHRTNRYRGTRRRAKVHVQLQSEQRQPLSGRRYELLAAGEVLTGETSGDGAVEQLVDALAQAAELRLFDEQGEQVQRVIQLALGHLDPIDSEAGVAARLDNLGYGGEQPLAQRIAAFQRAADLEPSGNVDDATRRELETQHRV